MVWQEWVSLIVYFLVLMVLSVPLSIYMTHILEGKTPKYLNLINRFENGLYMFLKINSKTEQRARQYLKDLLLFNVLGFIFVFIVLIFQGILPLNPQNFQGLSWHLALNTAVSFMTNTNWQAYSGEASLSHFSQMIGLTSQNFLSAATGLAVMAALARGLTRKVEDKVGNFKVDVVRITLYLLLPLSFLLALILLSQGVIQSFSEYINATTLEGNNQLIPSGQAASQIAIKQLGTNGGGFFGVNSAHPFENPTPISNFFQMLSLLLLPVAQVLCFGRMIFNKKHAYALLASMFLIFLPLLILALTSELKGVPGLGPNLEGKDVRIGVMDSTLWSVVTTAASNGSVNSMHSSMTPLTGLTNLFSILTGEVVFGGVGSGLYGMILYVLITVFLAGLMVGRSPEYLGKKIEAYEVKMSMVALLIPSLLVLVGSSLGAICEWGTSAMSHLGQHGFSEILYGFASTSGNNGSAYAGLSAGSAILNTIFSFCMLVGRFVVIIPVMEIAGSLARKKITPSNSGTFPTEHILFVILLTGVVIIFGALTFFPMLVLGPIAEHLLMLTHQVF